MNTRHAKGITVPELVKIKYLMLMIKKSTLWKKRIVTSHLAVLICFFIDSDVDTTFNLAPLNDCLSIDIKERRRKKKKRRDIL